MSDLKTASGGPAGPPGGNLFRRWLHLVLISALIGGVVVAVPVMERATGLAPAVETVRESGIEAGAFFYTDVEKVRDAQQFMHHIREYAPARSGDTDGR